MVLKNHRIILDTNIWISYLITKNHSLLDDLLINQQITILFSEELLNEFFEVINRPKLKKYFKHKDLEVILELIENYGELIEVKSKIEICRDYKDNFLLSLAVDGKANYLISGDADLLVLKKNKEVTRTLYDIPFGTFPSNTYFAQRNMRGRVSSIQYFETLSSGANATGTYNQAVHYTYDIHGNVDVLMREMPNLSSINQAYKTTHYEYDLVSGKVNQVIYQKKHADQFAHKYSYDGDNRIINTYTSTNLVHWDKEAHYSYYLHGPLKRTELGELKVQGVDYAYTLHGWLKGVNSTTLQEDRDIGQDGNGGSINQFVAKDVFGFSLGYYEGDHTPIGMNRTLNPLTIAQQFTPSTVGTTLGNASPNLFNGNIRHMVTAILPFMNAFNPQARAYNYDQLNRIKDAYTYNQVNLGSNIWSTTAPAVSDYEEHFSYDPNGNIMTLQRNGTTVGGGALLMDNFTYNYTSGKNQLTHVDDVVPLANYGDDIDDQLSGNYSYDEIGNLISDQAEQIQEIKWTVYGKIKSIIRSSGSTKPNLAYEYSPDGHRVYKKVTQPNGNIKETYYIRDAQGNTMSTYTYDTDTFRWSESHIYGSSRIGVYNAEQVLVIGNTANSSTLQANEYENIRGKRHYELSNHLGNVLAVVSDRRTGICTGNGLIAYNAEVVSATDYYAFGSPMPGRQGIQQCSTVTNTVNVTNYSAQEDFSSSSVGGFVAGSGSRSVSNPTGNVLRLESIWTARPLATRSVAVAANTNYTVNFDIVGYSNLSNFTENVRVRIIIPGGSTITQNYTATGSHSLYFTSVTAGNITVEISQVITGSGNYGINPFVDIDNFSVTYITTTTSTSTVCSVWDKGYRYGFNTQERDEDIAKGHYTAEYWEYDSRLGRRWNLDPVDQVWMSNYSVLMNCPVVMIDFWGDNPSPNNYEKSAINRAEKLSKKNPGYIVTLEKGNTNEEFIISIHKPDIKKTISVNTPKDNKILYEFNISQSTVGYKEVHTEIYKVGRWDKFVAMFGKGNATFSFGVVFTSKNGGNSNKFASILDPDGKFITVDEEIMSIFGSLKLKPESNNSVLTRSLNTGITKDKEGMDQTIRETANTSGESLGVKNDKAKEEYNGFKVLKRKKETNPKDGKLYYSDSVTNKKGWIKFFKPVKSK